ncbi:hypothetical protein HanPSC8_Chr17g0750581 [Helianthus annuus]|nr:hypothetical protein HanPSC8_Chr17g0750581 [Helianthus annuus]
MKLSVACKTDVLSNPAFVSILLANPSFCSKRAFIKCSDSIICCLLRCAASEAPTIPSQAISVRIDSSRIPTRSGEQQTPVVRNKTSVKERPYIVRGNLRPGGKTGGGRDDIISARYGGEAKPR